MAVKSKRIGISVHRSLLHQADLRWKELNYTSRSKYLEALMRDDTDDSPAHEPQREKNALLGPVKLTDHALRLIESVEKKQGANSMDGSTTSADTLTGKP